MEETAREIGAAILLYCLAGMFVVLSVACCAALIWCGFKYWLEDWREVMRRDNP